MAAAVTSTGSASPLPRPLTAIADLARTGAQEADLARWRAARVEMENSSEERATQGRVYRRRWWLLSAEIRLLDWGLRRLGLAEAAARRACNVVVRPLTLAIPGLDPRLDGTRILHLSDLHADAHPNLAPAIAAAIRAAGAVDLCLLTGDYRFACDGAASASLPALEVVAAAVRDVAPGRALAVLGNHDSAALADGLETRGLRFLHGESVVAERAGARLRVFGSDDVVRFCTPDAHRRLAAAAASPAEFRIALVHSQGLCVAAAAAGYDLYLSGHTHGGQIALPFGLPIITHRDSTWLRTFGRWRIGQMVGATSSGAGFSGTAIRLCTRSEVVLMTLRAA